MPLQTPIAFFIFNRPETTRRVFERIREQQPAQLLIVADGPRPHKPDDAARCLETRQIVETIDWECEVLRHYSDSNLGCRARVSSGLNWVFEKVDKAIILEDDCLPDPSFFRYCEALLEYHAHDERVMHISGDNFFPQVSAKLSTSYYFSRYPHAWGWATWRRAWRYYDVSLPALKDATARHKITQQLAAPNERRFWRKSWDGVLQGSIDSWAHQWVFACMIKQGLAVNPRTNLIANIGFGKDATNTLRINSQADLPTQRLEFPLEHPSELKRNEELDALTARLFFDEISTWKRRIRKVMRVLTRRRLV